MTLYAFFSPVESTLAKAFRILSLAIWAAGGFVHIYNIYEAAEWTRIFPLPNALCTASWLMTVALHFVSTWLPLGFLLIHWRIKRIDVMILYTVGCAVALLLSIVALLLIQNYRQNGYLRDQYFELIKQELKGGFPPTIEYMMRTEKCCSWYGPTDFGDYFNLTSKKDSDLKFMKSVAECYGKTFEVQTSSLGGLSYSPASSQTSRDIPKACGNIYKTSARRICYYITSMTFIVCFLSPVFIVLYILNYKNMEQNTVSPLATSRNEIQNVRTPVEDFSQTTVAEASSEMANTF